MVTGHLKLAVDNAAKASLREAYRYIKDASPQNAEKIRNKILSSFKELLRNPERHAADKYRINNDGSYRAYEIYKYRISYHISPSEIRVLRVRHTKMNPLEY